MYRVSRLLGAFFVIAFTIFLVTSNVRWAFNSIQLYEFGFSRHQVASSTGLTHEQLADAARQIRDYFNSPGELLDVRIIVDGSAKPLFNDREIGHMRDVKDLVLKVYRVQEGAFLFLFLFVALDFFALGSDFARRLRQLFVKGSLLTMVLVALVGVIAVVGFGPLFILFHRVSFTNDLWQLDPYSSYLVRMFPQGFWMEATMLIGLASVVEAAGILVLLVLIRWWQQWRQRVAQRKAPQFV